MDGKQGAVVAIVLFVALFTGWYFTYGIRDDDPMQERDLLRKGQEKPTLWIYVNDSEVNARYWADFSARSSRVMNIPFLNLCYETIVKMNGADYKVEVIGGLTDLAVRLGGWETLPVPLRNAQASVREPELNWIRAAVLARWGGLWVSPAAVFLQPMGELPKDKTVLFGTDEEVTFAGPGGTDVPALRVAWSPKAGCPCWVNWEERARERLNRQAGGSEFRRDEKSDTAEALRIYGDLIEIRPTAELGRKGRAGRRIQLEDILAAGQEGEIPFDIGCGAVYLAVPWPELKERRAFGWFLRMSEDQILDSDLAISWIIQRVLNS